MKSLDGAAAFEHHKSQLIAGLTKIGEDIQQLQSAFQDFTQFISSSTYTPNGQTVFAVDTPGKPGRKRKFKDEDGRKPRKVKDPNAPRRPASSYILFQNDIRPSLREKFPNLAHTELMNRVSKMWAELPAGEKEAYERQHAEAKVAYEEAKVQYEHTKNGTAPAPVGVSAAVVADSSDAETESPPAVRVSSTYGYMTCEPGIQTKKEEEYSEEEDVEEDVEEDEDIEEEEDAAPPKKKSKSTGTPNKGKKDKKHT